MDGNPPLWTHTVIGGSGVGLHVHEVGNRAGRPLLFIHSCSECRLIWLKQLQSDLADEFRLVAIDLRGHGLSEKPPEALAYTDSKVWADDIHAVMTTLDLDHPILIVGGYSGIVACDYLRVHGDGKLGGLNLTSAISKFGVYEPRAVISAEAQALGPGLSSTVTEESVRTLIEALRMCVHGFPSEVDLYFWLGFHTLVPPYVREAMYSRVVDNDDVLRQITKPVLLTHGYRDVVVFPEATKQHARLIPHAKISFYSEVGHFPYWEHPDRFNSELRAFANACP